MKASSLRWRRQPPHYRRQFGGRLLISLLHLLIYTVIGILMATPWWVVLIIVASYSMLSVMSAWYLSFKLNNAYSVIAGTIENVVSFSGDPRHPQRKGSQMIALLEDNMNTITLFAVNERPLSIGQRYLFFHDRKTCRYLGCTRADV